MPYVTVYGATGGSVAVQFESNAYANLARSLLNNQFGTLITGPGTTHFTQGGVLGVGPVGDVTAIDDTSDTGELILTGVGTNLVFNSLNGSGSIIAGGGDNIFTLGTGDWLLDTPSDGNVANLGTGQYTITSGGADIINGGAGDATIFGASSGAVIHQDSGSLLYVAGDGDNTVDAGTGALTAFSGSGTTTYLLASGSASIIGGSGISSVVGGKSPGDFFTNANGGTITYSGAANGNEFIAAAGNQTLNGAGGTGDNAFWAGSGNDQMTGGTGNDTLVAGTGNSTLTGGLGANLFAFFNDVGGTTNADLITDFSSQDSLYLGIGLSIEQSTVADGNLSLALSDGTTVTFVGITGIDPTQING